MKLKFQRLPLCDWNRPCRSEPPVINQVSLGNIVYQCLTSIEPRGVDTYPHFILEIIRSVGLDTEYGLLMKSFVDQVFSIVGIKPNSSIGFRINTLNPL